MDDYLDNGTRQPRTAVLYARVASRRQPEAAEAISQQLSICRQIAEGCGLEVVQEFSESGRSGMTADRPGLLGLLRYVRYHSVDYVIAARCDWISRDPKQDTKVRQQLQGIRTIDGGTTHDELVTELLATFRRYASKAHGEAIRNGKARAKARRAYAASGSSSS